MENCDFKGDSWKEPPARIISLEEDNYRNWFDRKIFALYPDSKLVEKLDKLSETIEPYICEGEPGSGTSVFVAAVHDLGKQKGYLKDHFCLWTNIIKDVKEIETVLFGHQQYSDKGYLMSFDGLIKENEGGTLATHLDKLPMNIQNVLNDYARSNRIAVGGTVKRKEVKTRIAYRVIGDTIKLVEEGKICRGLYNSMIDVVKMPNLRDHKDDIPYFMHVILYSIYEKEKSKYQGEDLDKKIGSIQKVVNAFDEKVMDKFMEYHWPGNLKELTSKIENAILYGSWDHIRFDPVNKNKIDFLLNEIVNVALMDQDLRKEGLRDTLKSRVEKALIMELVKSHGKKLNFLSSILGVNRNTLANISAYKNLKEENLF